jgi:arginase
MNSERRINVRGFPFGGGQYDPGVALGPHWLRQHGLLSALRWGGLNVRDRGYMPGLSTGRLGVGAALAENWRIATDIRESWGEADLVLNLGGDHGIGLGTVAATLMRHPSAGVLWVDAHGDINTPETSPTGNFHGMPLAALLGLILPREMRGGVWSWAWSVPRLDPSRLVLIGARDLDPGERELIERYGIRVFDSACIRRYGIDKVMDFALSALSARGARQLHLSFDIDALDPIVAPSTGTPVSEGLSRQEGVRICQAVAATGRLVAMDFVEFNPSVRPQFAGTTAETSVELINAALESSPAMYLGGELQWRNSPTRFLG